MSIIANTRMSVLTNATQAQSVRTSEQHPSSIFTSVLAGQVENVGQTTNASDAQSGGGSPEKDGLVIAGKFYTAQQIKDFYASGGDDYTFAQSLGLRDQNFIHDLVLQARAMGGGITGEDAERLMFNQYQRTTPDGVTVNDFDAWKSHQSPAMLAKVRAGTYVGAAIDPKDFEIGGIFAGQNASFRQNGLDANGMSDKWIAGIGFAESAPAYTATSDTYRKTRLG